MPAAWTTPRTWTAGELVTAAIGNSAWRDNLMYLKDSPTFDGSVTVTGTIAGAAMTLSSTLGVTGATTLSSTVATGALTVTGAATVSTTLGVTGATTLSSTVATGALTITGAATYTTNLKSTTALATPAALTATQATAFASTVSGSAIMGFGTTNDVSLMNRAGTVVLGIGPNTTTVNMTGAMTAVSGTFTNNALALGVAAATGTSNTYQRFSNTGGNTYLGLGSSAGGLFTGGTAYAASFGTEWAGALELATNNTVRVKIDSNGAMTKPAQPAFLATAATQSNVTGDGTDYTITFTTEIFDQASNFSTSTFTAPVTGRYQLNTMIGLTGLSSAHTNLYVQIITSNRTYTNQFQRGSEIASDTYGIGLSVLADMDAADTATVHIVVTGGTKIVDIVVGGQSTFSGFLAC